MGRISSDISLDVDIPLWKGDFITLTIHPRNPRIEGMICLRKFHF
jgi:hypothetical protein